MMDFIFYVLVLGWAASSLHLSQAEERQVQSSTVVVLKEDIFI